jgi:hypothetical protein
MQGAATNASPSALVELPQCCNRRPRTNSRSPGRQTPVRWYNAWINRPLGLSPAELPASLGITV